MKNDSPSIAHPPPELVEQWIGQAVGRPASTKYMNYFATQAANWGADQELEACIEWLGDAPVVYNNNVDLHPGSYLREARRPKPKSQAGNALEALDSFEGFTGSIQEIDVIRAALERLRELEQSDG